MSDPRIALYSRRSVEAKVWQASQYEFEDVVAEVDDARFVLPRPLPARDARRWIGPALNRVGRPLGRPRRAPMRAPADTASGAELFFAVFAAPHEIGGLPHVRPEVQNARRRVAFIVEMYTTSLPGAADYLRQLRGFDHVFVFTRDVLPAVRELTGAPTSYLPTGVDALLFAPEPPAPPRSIDVTSYGRRLPETHAALRASGLHYDYDTVRGVFDVSDHRDHRAALAATLQRSRFTVVYKNNDEAARRLKTGGEETLTNRFFEAACAGSIILGSRPDTPDFAEAFPWDDVLLPIPAPAPEIADIIARLGADGERLERARRAGILASLRRHDWSHRWTHILDSVGLAEHENAAVRATALAARAARTESSPPPPPEEH